MLGSDFFLHLQEHITLSDVPSQEELLEGLNEVVVDLHCLVELERGFEIGLHYEVELS